jgi:hypothetical protein
VPWTTVCTMRVYVGDYYAMKIQEIESMEGYTSDYAEEAGNCKILYAHIENEAHLFVINKNKTCIDLLGTDLDFGFNQHDFPVLDLMVDKDKGMVTFSQRYTDPSDGGEKEMQYQYDISRNVLYYQLENTSDSQASE